MISRLIRTALTFAVVLLAYLAYALIAAPLIEPNIEIVSSEWEPISPSGVSQIDLTLFPEGAWERNEPKVLEASQGTLLFDDFKQLENGDLRLPRCTLISYVDPPKKSGLLPNGDRSNASVQARPRPVVMQASQGAVLRFASPPNYTLGRFGHLVGGKLLGDVTIFSPASSSAGDDALHIETTNIQIDQKRIWAPSLVSFRFGRNRARGRDFSIHLERPQHRGGRKKTAMGRIRSLVLENVDHAELQVEGDLFAMVTGDQQTSVQQTPASHQALSARRTTPIEIKCQGPFRFDFGAQIASLEERVDVIRHNLDGPSDQLNCELLEIHLMPKNADVTTSVPDGPDPGASDNQPAKSRPGAMQPKKIIAVGFPVMIRAPSVGAGARAKRMEYDFITRRVELSGDEKTTLFSEQYYVEAPRLEYELLQGGRLGRLQAAGPGLVRGRVGKERRPFEATWAGSVSLLPQGQNKVLSLVGQANLEMADLASLKADELHLYLVEVPRPGSDQVDVRADRMQANGHIELDSSQLIAFLADAQIWFRQPTAAEMAAAKTDGPAGENSSGLFERQAGSAAGRPTKLRLTAGMLRGQIVLTETPQLEALDLQHNVRVNEIQPVAKSALDIAAQRVVLERGNSPTAELTLSGAPARFSAEGMTLDGGVIRVQLASNVASVEGPGSMLMLPQHVAFGADGQSKPLNVHWKKSMWFDGQTARFDGDIETRGGHVTKDQDTIQFVATGEVLKVLLNRPVKFTDPTATDVDASRLSFLGMTRLDSRTVDSAGAVTSIDSMVVRDLVIDRQTGRVTGEGPGNVIHRGPNPKKNQNQTASQRGAGLIFLRVDFENQMVGNIDQREVEFLNGTRTILGPITEWNQSLDPQRPDLLGEYSVILTSRRLAAADMRAVVGDQHAIEIEATGNAFIRGRQFSASGDRVSYIKAKDQLVIEGDGRTKSTLEFQRQSGAAWQKLSAEKILFYPQTSQFALDNFELELDGSGLSERSPNPRTPAYLPAGSQPPAGSPSPPAVPPTQAYRNRRVHSSN